MPLLSGVGDSDAGQVVAFIVEQQADTTRRITYVGVEPAGIRAELDALEPPWLTSARVVRGEAGLTGAVVVEVDEDQGRAWIVGPWARGDGGEWLAMAGALLDTALDQLSDGVVRLEMCGHADHELLGALARSRDWETTEPNHVFLADAEVVAGWPALPSAARFRPGREGDVDAIATLHDVEFPNTYASASELVDGQLDGSRSVFVAEAEPDEGVGPVVGYAAGEVHSDGEGFIDYVVVDPLSRGAGIGAGLIQKLTRDLLERSPLGRVALTVQDHRHDARRLYERMGFRMEETLVAYRLDRGRSLVS